MQNLLVGPNVWVEDLGFREGCILNTNMHTERGMGGRTCAYGLMLGFRV